MSAIATVEDTVLAAAGATFGSTLRKRESLGGGWTMEMLDQALQKSPGVYVAFLGGGKVEAGVFDGRFMVYAVTKGAREVDRRVGNQRVIGAYEIVERLLPRLDGLLVAGIGSLTITGVDNLFREAMFDLGGTVYGIGLTLPNLPLAPAINPADLADFVTFAADYDLPPFEAAETKQQWVAEPPDYTTGAPELQDHLTLPQE